MYKKEEGREFKMLYRQFGCQRPFFVAEPKTRDPNNSCFLDHENVENENDSWQKSCSIMDSWKAYCCYSQSKEKFSKYKCQQKLLHQWRKEKMKEYATAYTNFVF